MTPILPVSVLIALHNILLFAFFISFICNTSEDRPYETSELSVGLCAEYAPVWKKDMNEKPVVYMQPPHSTVRLRCDADGKPKPSTTWYKDGQELPARPFGKVGTGYSYCRPIETEEQSVKSVPNFRLFRCKLIEAVSRDRFIMTINTAIIC